MVARAMARMWFNVFATVVVGTALQPSGVRAAGPGLPGALPAAGAFAAFAQVGGGSSGAHLKLTAAIESQRRGEYEAAATLFEEAAAPGRPGGGEGPGPPPPS